MKTNNLTRLFCSDARRKLYASALAYLDEEKMTPYLTFGTLLGLSGGADSVFALGFLLKYAEENHTPRPVCVHVHHGIRGESADRDAAFCRELCESVGVELIVRYFDVPALAKEQGIGIEEMAREVRYRTFQDIISSRDDLSFIVTAHNATDNLETVLHRMLRGAGTLGLCGIPPVNQNVIRPLLSLPKSNIASALIDGGVPFVTDETNLENDHTRNYLRNEILPRLQRLTKSPEVSLTRLTRNLRMDEEYFSKIADSMLASASNGTMARTLLSSQHPAVLSRILRKMSVSAYGISPEKVHLDRIAERLPHKGDFEITMPGGIRFVAEGKTCYITDRPSTRVLDPMPRIVIPRQALTDLSPYGYSVFYGDEKNLKSFLNVYKIAIEADLSSAIIEGELYVRPRLDGDKYRTRGMTRRLKTMLHDSGIPKGERDRIPVFCDVRGIVFVPALGAREDLGSSPNGDRLFLLLPIDGR